MKDENFLVRFFLNLDFVYEFCFTANCVHVKVINQRWKPLRINISWGWFSSLFLRKWIKSATISNSNFETNYVLTYLLLRVNFAFILGSRANFDTWWYFLKRPKLYYILTHKHVGSRLIERHWFSDKSKELLFQVDFWGLLISRSRRLHQVTYLNYAFLSTISFLICTPELRKSFNLVS